MEKKIASFKDYEIFMADHTSLYEVARFVVEENYVHHLSSYSEEDMNADIASVLAEEQYLYSRDFHIYIARTYEGRIIGCIRSFRWDRRKTLPIEKIYGINPLEVIHEDSKYSYWHIGRFAIARFSGISTMNLFKRLMALAVRPVMEDKYSYIVAEIDSKLLKVMKVLGFVTRQVGKSIDYLTSETVPICASKRGLNGFYSKYGSLSDAV